MLKYFNLQKKLAFFVGLSLCNNIFYIFSKNNFYLNIANFIDIISFVLILIFEKNNIKKYFKSIDNTFYFYIFACLFSLVPAIFSLSFDISLLSSFINGLPILFLLFIKYFVIMSFSKYKEHIITGIKWGFILNIIISFVQFIYFISGDVFLLFYKLFPTPSFQVCGKFSRLFYDSSVTTSLKVYFFRAQGLFLETSYFTTFVVGAFLLAFFKIKNKIVKFIVSFLTIILCLLSESGNFIILLFLFILYYIIVGSKKKFVLKRKSLLIIALFLFLILLSSIYILDNDYIMKKISNTFLSTDLTDVGNDSRMKTLKEGWELVLKYPLGIGYNMTSKIFKLEYPMEIHSYIFSTILVNQLELGLLGNIIYLFFALKFPLKILKYSKEKDDIIVALSILGLFMCQASNGINYWNIQFIIGMYAIGNIVYNEIKYRSEKHEDSFYRSGC